MDCLFHSALAAEQSIHGSGSVQIREPFLYRRFAAHKLVYHQFANNAVENQFIPAVKNAQFKRLLESALRTFKVHEQHAEKLNGSLKTTRCRMDRFAQRK